MPTYFIGILSAFIEPVFHGWANILDNYLSGRLFKRLTPLIFFSSCVGMVIIPIIWIIDPPSVIPLHILPLVIAISAIEVFYLYPYYWSLRKEDTSVVASLFSLGEIFVPIAAFFLVGERLSALQYVGFFIITISSVAITLDIRKLRFNKALIWMFIVSSILSLEIVLLKYVYEKGVGWGSSMIYIALFSFVISGGAFLWQAVLRSVQMRRSIRAGQAELAKRFFDDTNTYDKDSHDKSIDDPSDTLKKFRSYWPILFCNEVLSLVGTLGGAYALYLIPASVVNGISGAQPLIILIYAILFSKKWPKLFHEYLGRKYVTEKALFFVLMILGVLLIAGL